jgi:hypothetical protein
MEGRGESLTGGGVPRPLEKPGFKSGSKHEKDKNGREDFFVRRSDPGSQFFLILEGRDGSRDRRSSRQRQSPLLEQLWRFGSSQGAIDSADPKNLCVRLVIRG